MIESTARMRGHEAAGRRRSDAQWIEVFAHSFVTQRHITVRTRGVTAKEGTVTQINPDSVQVVGIHGAGHQIPFRGIEEVTPVGEAATPLGPMARGERLRLETADDIIEKAEMREIVRSGIAVAETFDGSGFRSLRRHHPHPLRRHGVAALLRTDAARRSGDADRMPGLRIVDAGRPLVSSITARSA